MEPARVLPSEPPATLSGSASPAQGAGNTAADHHGTGGEPPTHSSEGREGGLPQPSPAQGASGLSRHDGGDDAGLSSTMRLTARLSGSDSTDGFGSDVPSSEIGSSAAADERRRRSIELQPFPLRSLGPKKPKEALLIEREDRRRMVRLNADRKVWGPTKHLLPRNRSAGWNERHQLCYKNDGLNPSYRSYFDRWIDYREPKAAPLGKLKPEWKLHPDGSTPKDRDADKQVMIQFSPCYRPPADETHAKPPRRQREGSDNVFDRLYLDASHDRLPPPPGNRPSRPRPGGGGSACTNSIAAMADSDDESPLRDFESDGGAASGGCDDVSQMLVAAEVPGVSWDDRHHITWSNDRQIFSPSQAGSGRVLNPMLLRSYFDRARTPLHSRCEESQKASKVLPVWRLEPLGSRAAALESVKPTGASSPSSSVVPHGSHENSGDGAEPPALHRTTSAGPGGGGSPSPKPSFASQPGPPVGDRGLPLTRALERKQKKWHERHSLTFKNEEVSRLDRSYFDRWREPEALKVKSKPQDFTRQTLVWSLEKTGSPEQDAKKVCESADARFNDDGKWMTRHHQTFSNEGLQPNLRSFFDRNREPENLAGGMLSKGELAELSAALEGSPSFQKTTESRDRGRRAKLTEAEKMPVQWKLQTPKTKGKKPPPYEHRLRESNSDSSIQARSQQRRREAWFSSHGVVF